MKMKLTNCIFPLLLLLLASSSCLADSQQQQHQQSVQSEQSFASAAGGGENSEKSAANAVDKNKRGAPSVPVVVGTPAAQHTAYINHHVVAAPISGHATHAAIGAVPFGYGHELASGGHILQTPGAAVATAVPQYNYAVPQLTYTHYPQYQLVQHHHHQQTSPVGGTLQPATIYATHTALHEHPVAEIATHHHQPQHQQQTAYAHQQPIYAPHPAAIHYSVALPGQHNYAGQQQQQQPQQQQQQPQQQQQHPLSHTQAIHYQQQAVASGLAGQQPAVPIVHQAPIAAINQVHQAQQVYATQGQLTKYPLAGTSLYGAGGLQNQIYSTVPSYGDPDTLTNLANPEPSTPSDAPRRYPTVRPVSRPGNVPNDIRPITEYEDDYGGEGTDAAGDDNDLYRDEQPPSRNGAPAGGERVNEPCDKDSKKSGQPSAFNRHLYNMWRAYDLGRALLKASGASGTTPKPRTKPSNGDSTDRIQLIHPPGESDKKLKGKYYEGRYYAYNRAGRQETNRSPKSVNPGTTSTTTRTPSSRRRKLD